ncbi:MAG: hypothetical protein ACOZAN_02450 [Patescibacteria group bacterium]
MKITNLLSNKVTPLFALVMLSASAATVARFFPVGAKQDETAVKVMSLTKKLQDSVAEVNSTGQFITDERGEKIYAGETAKQMEDLHKQIAGEIRELQARPETERRKTIEAVNKWNDQFLYQVENQPKQELNYAGKLGGVQNVKRDGLELYYSQDYAFQVDTKTNKVVDVYIRPKEKGEKEEWVDMTARFKVDELEKKARKLIADQNLGIDLDSLKLEVGQKIGTFFFTWKNDSGSSIQVAYTQGGQLIGYTNAGFFEQL